MAITKYIGRHKQSWGTVYYLNIKLRKWHCFTLEYEKL